MDDKLNCLRFQMSLLFILCFSQTVVFAATWNSYYSNTGSAPERSSEYSVRRTARSSIGYGPLGLARVASITAVHAPYAVGGLPVAPPNYIAPSAPTAPIITGYAATAHKLLPLAPRVAPFSAVAHVPVPAYETRTGFVQRQFDIAQPLVNRKKIQVKRPAIQKQFYDVEERVIIRPVGSALLELDPPDSTSQSGPGVISPAAPVAIPASPVAVPVFPRPPVPPPMVEYEPSSSGPPSSVQPETPSAFPGMSQNDNEQGSSDDSDDSITIDSQELRSRSSGKQEQLSSQRNSVARLETASPPQMFARVVMSSQENNENARSSIFMPEPSEENRPEPQGESRSSLKSDGSNQIPPGLTSAIFLSRSRETTDELNSNVPVSFPSTKSFTPSSQNAILPSARSYLTEEESKDNQQKFIGLLTGRGGVVEVVPSSRSNGFSVEPVGEAGQIRGRVLSVTPAPELSAGEVKNAEGTERVSTRRVVVTRPVQTFQEVEVVQPFTQLQRVTVQKPTVFKTPILATQQRVFLSGLSSPYAPPNPYARVFLRNGLTAPGYL